LLLIISENSIAQGERGQEPPTAWDRPGPTQPRALPPAVPRPTSEPTDTSRVATALDLQEISGSARSERPRHTSKDPSEAIKSILGLEVLSEDSCGRARRCTNGQTSSPNDTDGSPHANLNSPTPSAHDLIAGNPQRRYRPFPTAFKGTPSFHFKSPFEHGTFTASQCSGCGIPSLTMQDYNPGVFSTGELASSASPLRSFACSCFILEKADRRQGFLMRPPCPPPITTLLAQKGPPHRGTRPTHWREEYRRRLHRTGRSELPGNS
jgi:hypothetical protein